MANNIIVNVPRRTTCVIINYVQRRGMPVNVPPTATGKRRFRLAVETDPHKLVNYCCGLNYHIDEPPIKLKPDEEYPDWLWDLRLGPKPRSYDLQEGTKEYYEQLAAEGFSRNLKLKQKAMPKQKVVGKVLQQQQDYLRHIRFAALAHLEEDAGFDRNSMEQDWWSRATTIKARDYYLPRSNRVLYMDKIEGNIRLKNYHRDDESSFITPLKNVKRRPSVYLKAFQDSTHRHRYASN